MSDELHPDGIEWPGGVRVYRVAIPKDDLRVNEQGHVVCDGVPGSFTTSANARRALRGACEVYEQRGWKVLQAVERNSTFFELTVSPPGGPRTYEEFQSLVDSERAKKDRQVYDDECRQYNLTDHGLKCGFCGGPTYPEAQADTRVHRRCGRSCEGARAREAQVRWEHDHGGARLEREE